MDTKELKKELVELFQDYCVWNDKKHIETPDPSHYLSFEGFIYWLGIDENQNE